jgi:hypothetical protein
MPDEVLYCFLTVLFLVAGFLLIWLNFRRRSRDIILTKIDDDDLSKP